MTNIVYSSSVIIEFPKTNLKENSLARWQNKLALGYRALLSPHAVAFECLDEISWCYQSNEISWVELWHEAIYFLLLLEAKR